MVPSESSLPLPRQQQQDGCYYSVLVKDSNVVTVTTKCSEEKPSMDTLIDGFYNLSHNNDNGEKQKQARHDYKCAYTCARTTCERKNIFQYELHVKRLIDSTRAVLVTSFGQEQEQKEQEKTTMEIKELLDQLHDMIKPNCALAMKTFSTKFENQLRERDHELKLTLAVFVVNVNVNVNANKTATAVTTASIRRSLDLYCHVGLLPTTASTVTTSSVNNNRIITVLIGGAKRANSTIKDANWVKQRKELFRQQMNHIAMNHHVEDGLCSTNIVQEENQKIEDIILLDNGNKDNDNDNDNNKDNPTLLEGTETNFFAVDIDGNVLTADHDVLKGTVRASVLTCCKMNSIPVKFQPVKLNTLLLNNDDDDDDDDDKDDDQQQQQQQQDRRFIQGAFLTSTSRLVLPIHQIIIPSRYCHPVTTTCPSVEETTITTYNFQTISPIILRIKSLVEDDMIRNSVKII